MPIATRASLQTPAQPVRAVSSGARGPGMPGIISSLQAYGGLQAWAARAHRPSQSLGRLGSLEVRLAQTAAEVRQAQKLRYRVFYQEGAAIPNPGATLRAPRHRWLRRNLRPPAGARPRSSTIAARSNRPTVVGTYRLLRQPLAEEYGGFYTAANSISVHSSQATAIFNSSNSAVRACLRLIATNGPSNFSGTASTRTSLQNRCDVMFGCASLDGTDPKRLALPLSFLHHYAAAPSNGVRRR